MNGLIAVIGLSARFPGAPTADDLWKLVLEGREGLVRYEPDALAATVPRALRTHPGFVPVGSDLGDIELFDAAAFGMGAHEAIHLDPAHRLFLEQAWLALDASGYGHGIGVDQVGVYAGTSQSGYLHTNLAHRFDALGGADPVSALTCAIGTAPDYLAMGTAYRLGLRGAAVTVQTACSTSLVAVHQAVSALLSGETDLALAGGSTVHVPRGQGYLHVPDGPFSHDGHTRSYGAGAGGAVFTQGVGVVVLKRLDDAIDDGDHIHAVVRGSATNNDGSDKAGFTAPSVIGQARVIAEAHAVAGVQPVDIGLIEGHGTGTLLGDPIEVRALSTVFGEVTTPWCALGSIKSNIGHTEAAAGIAGFIKAVLAVENGVLPRTLHAEEPNPALDLTRSAFAIANETRPWSDSARPRIAGVSSFGFGGTNAHVVVEQPPHRPRFERDRAIRPCVLTVTGASAASATTHADRIVASLPDHDVRDVAFTLTHGRARLSYRTATVVDPDGRELIDRVQPVPSSGPAPAVVFAFPGGGSQFPGMLAETYRTDPESRELIDTLAHEFADLTGRDLRAVCAPQECGLPADDGVRPAQGLPALFTACLVVARRLASVGVAPDVLVGHSLGEYVAAVVSGALGLRDAVRIVAARAVALEDVDAGAMLRVRRTADELIELLTGHPDVEIAALDAPRSTLLSGPVAAIDEVAAAAGDDASVIPVAAAGHSKLVDPALPTVRSAATGIVAAAPTIPVFSSATGRRLTASEVADPEHWVRHMRHPVRFSDALSAAVAEAGQQRDVVVVNVGPGAATASLTRAHRFESVRATVTSLTADGASSPLRCAAELAVHGVELSPPNGRRTRLPDYPFDRSRYWVEPDDRAGARPDSARWFTGRWTAAPAQPSAPDAIADAAVQVIGAGEFADRLRDRIGCAACVDPSTAAVLVWPVDPDTTATTAGRLAALTRTMVDRGARPVVVQVTVGAEIVAPGDVGDPRQCAARGYGRVLSQEVPGVEVCAVDVESTADAPEAIATIVGDRRGTAWSEYAWRSGIRYTRRYDESERQEAESVGYDVVLIVGGLGRLGAAIGTRLAAGGVRVVCTTRGPLADDRARDAAAHPSGLVDVVRLDPTDSVESAALLRRLHRDHGAVAVVHAAGTVGPEAFAELGSGDDDSHEVKAAVTRALIAAVDALATAERPHSVTVMSSLASIVGGYGLGAYAAVNRVVETLVADRARRDGSTRWLAIQWDGWSTLDTWRPAERSADAFTRRLLADALDPGDAVDSLVGALGSVDLSAPRGVLAVTRRDLRAPDPAVAVAVAVDRPAADAGVDAGVGGDLADLWAEVLGCDAVAPEADFFELGGHSLLATRLLAAVADRYGVTLRLRDLLGAPRLDQMADRIATQTGRGGEAPETHSELSQEAGPIASTDVPPSDGLTRVQHAYLVGRTEAFGTAAAACHSYLEFDCGDLDLDRFDAAFNAVLARHRMLRTVIRSERHREVPLPPGGFRTTRTDARGADPEAAASVWRTGLVTRTAAPDRWPLVAPHALLTDAGVRIGWSIDVLVCDASSFALLYAELGIAYRGEPLPAAPTVTFADVVARLEARTRSDAYRRSRDYWRARAATLPGPPVVWTGAPSIDAAGFDRLAITLDPGERDALRAWARSASTTESAAILTLYLRMLARWSGQRHFSVVTTSFDDRPAGVVGDFTELTVLEARVTDDAADDLRAVTTQLFEDLDHRGYSAVDVLADRGRVDGSRFTLPVVFTSTLGSDVGAGLDWAGPLVFGRSQTPQVYLDHQVYEFGGSLVLQWDHLTSVIDGADLAAAVGGLRAELAGLPGPRASSRVDIVRKAFADVLGLPVDAVGESTGFVAAGGDSVSAVRLVGALRRLLGVSVSIGAVVDGATPLDLAAMDADAPTGAGTVDLVRADDAQQVMDLLPLQQAYWVGQSGAWDLSYQSAHFYVDFHDPETDPDRLRQAVARLIAHQPMLRAEVTPDGRQRILDLDDPRLDATPVEIVDLTDADADGCARAIAATRAEWERTGPDPQVWPAFDVRAHLLPGGGARIHVRCSLVFVDGWSFYLFFAELLAFHDDPNTVLPTPDVSFADYVASVAAARRTPAWQADLAWWRSRLDDLPPAPALPRARAADAAESGEPAELMVRRTLRLDTADTGRLRARCAAQSVTMTAVVGAAYARALAEWSGQARFLLTMLFFNRLPVHDEIEQVLGPFASSTFLDVSADHRNVAGLVRGFGGAIGAVLDHALVSGVELGRELTRRTGRPAVIAPVVFTSTLGFSNAARDAATSRIDPADVYERVRTPQVLIDCQAAEENGSLVCNVDAAGGVFAAEELDALVARIGEFLEAVIVDDDAFAAELAPIEAPAADRPTAVVDVAHRTVRRKPSPSASIPETVREAWVAATGASEFGREDDFFTAGGDSLGMIRMLRAVGAAVGADIEPAAFLADPTPATLARLLPATVGPQLDQSLLVRLADGPGTPLYLIHPSGGDVLCYSGLARAVTDRPVIAVNDPELTGAVDDPVALGTIPALAAAYADAIATHCGAGDVVIGGWSMGGTLAHEVATILASDPGPAAVRPVGVVLIDSNVPDRIRALPGDSDRDRSTAAAVRYLGSLEAFLGLDLRSGTSSTTAALAGAPPGDHAAVVADLLADAGLPTTDVERRLDVFTRHLTGLGDHRASPFRAAPVLVLRALEPAPRNSGVGMGVDDVGDRPDLGWADHCADLRCRDVAAHHYSILDRPAVDEVAAHINEFCTETAKGEDR